MIDRSDWWPRNHCSCRATSTNPSSTPETLPPSQDASTSTYVAPHTTTHEKEVGWIVFNQFILESGFVYGLVSSVSHSDTISLNFFLDLVHRGDGRLHAAAPAPDPLVADVIALVQAPTPRDRRVSNLLIERDLPNFLTPEFIESLLS